MRNLAQDSDQQAARVRPGARACGRVFAAVFVVGLVTMPLAACGDDDDGTSSAEAFCEAGDQLQADVAGLADLDIISGGTDAIREDLEAIRGDLDDLRDSGSEVAADEIAELETAVTQLSDALDGLGDDIGIDSGRELLDSAGAVVDAATAVASRLSSTCS